VTKVIGPLHSSEARGRVDDLVYNTWRGIRYVRKFTAPEFKTPDPRIAQKARVAAANTAWRLLSAAQRTAWGAYAAQHLRLDWTGVPIRMSGYNAYVRLSTRVQRIGGTPLADAPWTPLPFPLTSLTLTAVTNAIRVAWTYPTQPTAHPHYVQILRAGPFSAGKTPPRTDAVIRSHEVLNSSPYDDAFSIIGHYGIWARVIDGLTGEDSPHLTADINVVPVVTGTVHAFLWDPALLFPIANQIVTCGGKSDTSDIGGRVDILEVPVGAQVCTPGTANYSWAPTHRDIVVVAGETYDAGQFDGTLLP